MGFCCSSYINFVACCLGIKLGRKSDINENCIIMSMHKNCAKMRKNLLLKEENEQFKIIDQDSYRLACIPAEFENVSKVYIPNILKDRERKDKEKKRKLKKMRLKIEKKEDTIQKLEREIKKMELKMEEMGHNDEQGE